MFSTLSRTLPFIAAVLIAYAPTNATAQRYLSEFVGSSKVRLTTAQSQETIAAEENVTAATVFNIAKISKNRDKATNALPFKGTFTLSITDGTSNTAVSNAATISRKFAHKGLLFSNGDCTADRKRS